MAHSRSKRKIPLDAHTVRAADKTVFYLTAFTTGAAVMMIELLGTRIIGPYYGVSLVVWTSLLSVALLSLSIGYLVGGRLADRAPWLRLSYIILLAALAIGVIPLISKPVQIAMNSLGLRGGALASAFILFALPLTLLGMVGPFVIKVATSKMDVLGSTAGNVYAISTLGSVIGTLVLGFFLLPVAGTQNVILSLSLALALLALGLLVYEHKRLKVPGFSASASAAVLLIAVLAGVTYSGQNRDYEGYDVLYEEDTHYGWVRVVDEPTAGIRWLLSGSSTIGAEALANGESLLGYQQVVKHTPWFNSNADHALLIGLGGGHLVNDFSKLGITTDSIEIDPAVAHAAKHYFSYEPSGELWVGDARYQIQNIDRRYDVIVHDCFTGGSEPIHLLTREMLGELKSLLNPGGILVVNFVGFTEGDLVPVASLARTLDETFSHRRTFVSSPGADFNDFIFVASEQPLALSANAVKEGINAILEPHEVNVSAAGGLVITDDFNPLEKLQLAKAEHYRNVLLDRIGADILFP